MPLQAESTPVLLTLRPSDEERILTLRCAAYVTRLAAFALHIILGETSLLR